MDYKRQTTVLSVIFVLVGMIFIVPATTGKAEAVIHASVLLHGQAAKLLWTLLAFGINSSAEFTKKPTKKGDQISWNTQGLGLFGATENGFVKYATGPRYEGGDVVFRFHSPSFGENTCTITVLNPTLHGDCRITQGNTASAFYNVFPKSSVNGGNGGGDEGEGSGGEGGGGDEGEGSGGEGGGY
jgi:hypothetical protein